MCLGDLFRGKTFKVTRNGGHQHVFNILGVISEVKVVQALVTGLELDRTRGRVNNEHTPAIVADVGEAVAFGHVMKQKDVHNASAMVVDLDA